MTRACVNDHVASPRVFLFLLLTAFVFPGLMIESGAGQTSSDASPIRFGATILIEPQGTGETFVEPYLAVDPQNQSHLVAAAMKLPTGIAVFSSIDGGKHWSRHDIDRSEGDPSVAIARNGTVYVAYIGPREEGHLTNVIKSEDGGLTWKAPIVVCGAKNDPQDHPVLALETTDSKVENTIYLGVSLSASDNYGERVSPVGLFKSSDGGHSFSGPTEILPNNFDNQNGSIAVSSNGRVILPFYELDIIDDAGSSRPLAHTRLWTSRSEDDGQKLSSPFFVAEAAVPGPPPTAQAMTNPERILLTWVGDRRVGLWYSANAGRTWAESAWEDSTDVRSGAEMSTVAVTRGGIVGLAWIKRTAMSESGACYQLLFTASFDGGKTLRTSKAVPDASWCARGRWSAGGDYFGLTSSQDGIFELMWADARDGSFRLRFTTIRVTDRQQ